MSATAGAAGAGPVTVWFLSDYGLQDEFVGVCHAVIRRLAPSVGVVDLTHGVPPFDVRAGAAALLRCLPHLGPGAVLAVVDPGVGGARRGVAVEVGGGAPRWLVGPDNGLLVPAATALGGALGAWELRRPAGPAVTFDGRDVFAPAAARLCAGADPGDLGHPFPPGELVAPAGVEPPETSPGRLRAAVGWVDRYGNVQLEAPAGALPAGGAVAVWATAAPVSPTPARRVGAYADLDPGELGVLADANGRAALVVREGSAATVLGVAAGETVTLTWGGAEPQPGARK